MKYKKGDTVRIRKDLENVLFDMPETFTKLCKYAGKTAKIIKTSEWLNSYVIKVDGMVYYFRENWLEPVEKENYPMSPADVLREVSMMVETMQLKEFDIQCTEGVINFSMAKNVEE